MSDTALSLPKYRLHKARNLAKVTIDGRDIYLGPYGSDESRAAYERVIGEWLARGRAAPASQARLGSEAVSVNEVMLAYIRWADGYYRDADGQPTREVETMKLVFRPLKALYGHTPAADFGPLALKVVRQRMIEADLCRKVVNRRVGYIRRMFKWASAEELIPPQTYHGLLAVDALKRGRSGVRDTEDVMPVPDEHVDSILPFLPPTLQTMVQLQRLTGMRSGELVRLRACDMDTGGPIWWYRPPKHKTAYLGHKRAIPLGAQCQALLRPFLKPDLQSPIFSPQQAENERDAIMRAKRKTPVQPSQVSRKKRHAKRKPGTCYDTRSYWHALRYAMGRAQEAVKLAEGEFWFPHQLRHSAARRIVQSNGLDAARAFLGHAKPDMTCVRSSVPTQRD